MEQHFVINIGRQLGSGGKSIAEELANYFKVTVYDKKLIDIAAQESGLSKEFFEKADEKAAKSVLRAFFGTRSGIAEYGYTETCLNNNELFKIQSDVIRQVAERESCIFVGRCADYILREHPRCVNVFITGNLLDRAQRLCDRQGIGMEEALDTIKKIDRKRANYYNYYSNRTWGEADTYHLCINSSSLGLEGTAEFVRDFVTEKLHL